jgi:hypothetical protein
MKPLIRIAVGAAIVGALATFYLARRSRRTRVLGRGTVRGFTVEELIAETPVRPPQLNS